MIRKKFLTALLFFYCTLPLFALGETWTSSAKISYFSPKGSEIRKIYGQGMADYQIEVTRSVFCNWQIWLDLDYYTSSGHIRKTGSSSRMHVLPLSLGISYNWKICPQFYWNVGLGGAYTHAHFQNYKSNHRDLNKWGGGAVFKTSLKYYLHSGIFFETFLDYFYQHFNHHRYPVQDSEIQNNSCQVEEPHKHYHYERKPTLNVGGTKIGIGIGYIF